MSMAIRYALILLFLAVLAPPARAEGHEDGLGTPPAAIPSDPVEPDYLRTYAVRTPADAQPLPPEPDNRLRPGRREVMFSVYLAGYAGAAHVGTRNGLSGDYRVMRYESAYMYDVFGHVFFTREIGLALGALNRWAGMETKKSRRVGAWPGAFGMQTFEELLNGFMPGTRLDPIDILSNAVGALWADGGQSLAERSPAFARLSLQYGFKSWHRAFTGGQSSAVLGNYWHDYPNGRWGVGYDIGPVDRRWLTLFATYEITSVDVATMKNRFGMGIELPVIAWFSPLIDEIPGGGTFLSVYNWFDDRFLLPLFYIQMYHIDAPAFSNRNPFP
jgi:hypothetical protein